MNPGGSRDSPLYLMEYESTPPDPTHGYGHMASGRRSHVAALEEQLLSYSENAENEGEEEAYLEEEVLQVRPYTPGALTPMRRSPLTSVSMVTVAVPQVDMATLAEQIIEATPERIKQEDFPRGAESPLRERRDNPTIQDTWLATYLETVDAHSHSPPR